MIKAVCFDVGNVLTTSIYEPSLQEIVGKYGLDYEKVKKIRRRILDKAELGEITEEEFQKRVIKETALPISVDYWKSTFKGPQPIIEVIHIVKELKSRGTLLGIISNRRRESVCKDRKSEFYPLFDVIVYSSEVGILKPDKRIYEIALERLNVSATECLFIDDLEKNVKAAQALGMDGIVFQSADQLRKELTNRHLL